MTEKEIQAIIERAVSKIVERKIVSILKNQQQNIQQGTVVSFSKGSHTANVRVYDTTLTLPYPSAYDNIIAAGRKCLIVSVDPKNRSNKLVVAIYA